MGREERDKLNRRLDELLRRPIPGEGFGGPAQQVHLMATLIQSVLLLDDTNERLSVSSERLATRNLALTVVITVLTLVQAVFVVFQFLLPLATK
jgi:hypothetical protein